MRTLLKVTIPVEKGNKAVEDGSMAKVVQSTLETLKPEAAYFFPENGERTAYYFFDLKDATDIPQIAETFFVKLNAKVQFFPVMNAADLKKGLEKAAQKRQTREPVTA